MRGTIGLTHRETCHATNIIQRGRDITYGKRGIPMSCPTLMTVAAPAGIESVLRSVSMEYGGDILV
ncbi:MAG TPA: hypothetical protein VIQ62_12285, partial [Burkholderiales bacterium]